MSSKELIQIEATTRCNFTCAFCPGRHLEQGDMDYDLFLNILEKYPEVRYLQLYGEGEPLMHPDFFEMARLAVEKNIKVSTITNGSLLNPENNKKIINSRLQSIHISLDSINPDIFHKLRGGNLRLVIENIKSLIELRNALKSAIPFVGFSVTVMNETQNELEGIFKLYQELGLDAGIIIQPLNEMDSYKKNYSEDVDSQGLKSSSLQNINQKLESNEILKEIIRSRRLELTFFQRLRMDFDPLKEGCPWLQRSLFVNIQGHAMPCSMIKDIATYSFGHIGKNSKASILSNRRKMQEQILSGRIPKGCYNCRTLDSYYKPGKMYEYKTPGKEKESKQRIREEQNALFETQCITLPPHIL